MESVTTMYRILVSAAALTMAQAAVTQPPEPVDPRPINGETYYLINQLSGLQIDLNGTSTASGDSLFQRARSFSSLTQRWAMTKAADGNWKISNIYNGLCLDSAATGGSSVAVQNPCAISAPSQEWSFTYTNNGYNVIMNVGSGLALDVLGSSSSAGAQADSIGALWISHAESAVDVPSRILAGG